MNRIKTFSPFATILPRFIGETSAKPPIHSAWIPVRDIAADSKSFPISFSLFSPLYSSLLLLMPRCDALQCDGRFCPNDHELKRSETNQTSSSSSTRKSAPSHAEIAIRKRHYEVLQKLEFLNHLAKAHSPSKAEDAKYASVMSKWSEKVLELIKSGEDEGAFLRNDETFAEILAKLKVVKADLIDNESKHVVSFS